MNLPIVIVGAGGHAKVVVDVLSENEKQLLGFIDPQVNVFFELKKIHDETLDVKAANLAMGLGGVKPDELAKRFALFHRYLDQSAEFPSIIAKTAYVSKSAQLGSGVFVNNAAVINGFSKISDLVIINTRAIIEHDVEIGEGSHIAPGATILGNCKIGKHCMIGSGAVVLPGSTVPDNTLIPALTRYPKKQ